MAKYQRDKGRRAEQEVVKFWKDIFPDAKRHWEFTDEEAQAGIDVVLDSWTGVQVKVGRQVPKKIYCFLDQMEWDDNCLKFVQCKRDYHEWLVILKAEDFKMLLALLKANKIL